MTTYAFYQGKQNARRKDEIRAFCKNKSLGTPVFKSPDYMKAIAIIHRSADKCILVGAVDDIIPPDEYRDSPLYEWREVFFSYIEEHGISFHPIDVDSYETGDSESRTAMTAIRSFRRSCKTFKQHIRHLDRRDLGAPYAFGRPPYGYDIIEGKLVINEQQAKAIHAIFKLNTKGKNIPDIVDYLKKRYSTILVRGKKGAWLKTPVPQNWDYTKVKRIISKSKLYCEGLYTGGNMTLKVPDIIIHPLTPSK